MTSPADADLWNWPTADLHAAADALNRRLHGDRVTYVVNRNANFTNVCTVGCAFCGFQRKPGAADAYLRDAGAVLARLAETPHVTEVCLQGGIHPELGFDYYTGLVAAIRERFPALHVHAFSPMEIHSLHLKTGRSYEFLLGELRQAGLDTIPGTAAEILRDKVRRQLSPNKLPRDRWVEIVSTAHRLGIRSTATVLYGHLETWEDLREHFAQLLAIQERTGGFTELVPLAFVPFANRLGRRLGRALDPADPRRGARQLAAAAADKSRRLYPLARLFFGAALPNLQTSWVKLGPALAAESLGWGCNDFGGTLYEESITRSSGGEHGECLEPAAIEAAIRGAGRTPVRRDTLYRRLPAAPAGGPLLCSHPARA